MELEAPLLSVRGLRKIYDAGAAPVEALRGIDLDFRRGEWVVLLGPSGSGKSTLLHLLGGLDRASSGEVRWNPSGVDLCNSSPRELTRFRRENVGFVFQFYNLIPSLTALENVELVTELALDSGGDPMSPTEALDLVGLGARSRHFPAELSGGEQQRVAIARAVAKRPQLLLCDEPTGALDVLTGKQVLEAILRVNREIGSLSIVITHNVAIARLAHRVIQISEGRIAQDSPNLERASLAEISW